MRGRPGQLRRHLGPSALALLNLLASTLLLLAPTVLGASTEATLALSIFLVSLQAGQASSVQTNARADSRGSLIELAGLVLPAASVCLVLIAGHRWPAFVALAMAGLLAGFMSGSQANALLRSSRGGRGYQLFILTRNVVWLTAVVLGTLVTAAGPLWGTAAVWTIFAGVLWFRNGRLVRLRFPVRWVTVCGALAALAYRNDVNIVRSAAGQQGQFEQWHYLLTGYALAQAMTGFLILQFLYASTGTPAAPGTLAHRIRFLPGVGAVAAVAAVLVFREADVVYLAVLLVLAACAVNVQAALAHAKGLSYVVYAAGLAGVGLCWLLARAAIPPAQLLAADLAVTAAVVFVGLLVASLLKQAKPDPADRVLVESGDRA
jgi:hypothetical protein